MDSFTPKSSFIEKVEYDEQARAMTITFKTGSQTRYLYVFPATWLSFKTSPDHSSFYSKAVKGKLMSVNIIKHNIGKQHSTPLKQHKQTRSLTNGNIYPNAGTVNRAFGGRKDPSTKSSK